jgi:superfamily II DNA or RNA helicase
LEVKDYFLETEAFIEGNMALRGPQRTAYMKLKKEFESNPDGHKMVVLPTGTGKTGVIELSPYKISKGRVLVITPNLVIREGISDDFDTRSQFNFWTKRNVILNDNHLPKVYRYAGYNTSGDKNRVLRYLNESNIIIANIQKVYSTTSRKTLTDILPSDFFDMIIIDEAHHSAADSWKKTLEHFNASKIIKFTATPFRGDSKELDGEIIYEFSLADAIKDGYVKNIVAEDYTNQKLEFVIDGKTVSKEEALAEMDSNWVTRSVAYSKECSKTIVDMSIERLNEKRKHGNSHHQILAVSCSIEHAREIKKLYEDAGLTADFVTSDRPEESVKAITEYRKGQIDVLVNVNMLGEGFDHPNISIAAIFRPFRSLPPYAQFIGRALRKIQEDNPMDTIDNVAHVIYHKELVLDDLWKYYTGEHEKAERRKRISLVYTNEDPIEKNLDIGEVKVDGQVIQTTKEFLTDGIGNQYKDEIQANIDAIRNEIQETITKMKQANIPQEFIDEFISNRNRDLEENITNKRQKLREDLLREELHDAHKQRVIEGVDILLNETGLPDEGTELPSNTTSPFLKKATSNSAYCIMYINLNLKQKLKRGIDEWEIYDFEQAEKLTPNILERLKEKIEGLD